MSLELIEQEEFPLIILRGQDRLRVIWFNSESEFIDQIIHEGKNFREKILACIRTLSLLNEVSEKSGTPVRIFIEESFRNQISEGLYPYLKFEKSYSQTMDRIYGNFTKSKNEESKKVNEINRYDEIFSTDASYEKETFKAGIAWIRKDGSFRTRFISAENSNVAELRSIILAVEDAPINSKILILTDSQSSISLLSTSAKNIRMRTNKELVKRFHASCQKRNIKVTVRWVKGHVGISVNEAVDALSFATLKSQGDISKENLERIAEKFSSEHLLKSEIFGDLQYVFNGKRK